MEIRIKEDEYLATHFKNRGQILENIVNFMDKKEILELDKFQDSWKLKYGEYIRKGIVLHFKNGDILDIRCYKNGYYNNQFVSVYVSAYDCKSKQWMWLGSSHNDKTVCGLVENFIDKCSSLKEELNNKVDNKLKSHFERFYVSRG